MRKPAKSKEQLINELGSVFRKNGFYGASLSKLTQATGLERASLYHHFPKGKADMAKAVLLHALQELDSSVLNRLREDRPAKEKLANMLKALNEFYSGGEEVCFITIFSSVNSDLVIAEPMAKAVDLWIKLLGKTYQELGLESSRIMAQNDISSIQGSLIVSNAMKDSRIFKNNLKSLKKKYI